MLVKSRKKWVNILALGLAGLGLVHLGKNYVAPEILGRAGNNPNIVLISIDTLRADYFTPEYLPETWKWVNEDCLYFTNAHATSTWTTPSHLTMLTGLLPHEHQVELALDLIPDDLEMVQHRLQRKGYETIAFTGGGFVGSDFGFSRGFSEWHENSSEDIGSFIAAKKYLSSLSDSRFDKPKFLFLHTFYIHKFDENSSRKFGEFHPDKYDKRVRDFDEKLIDMINSVLESSISDNLRMIITSDHGEGFGEIYDNLYDREFISEYHGDWPCPSQVRIPLLIYDSQNTVGGSLDKLVGLDNLSPTIEVWAGIVDFHKRYLLSKDERDSLLSETIPLVGLDRVMRKGEDITKRGVAEIGRNGEYIKTSATKRFGKEKQKLPGKKLGDAKKKELEALGYLIP